MIFVLTAPSGKNAVYISRRTSRNSITYLRMTVQETQMDTIPERAELEPNPNNLECWTALRPRSIRLQAMWTDAILDTRITPSAYRLYTLLLSASQEGMVITSPYALCAARHGDCTECTKGWPNGKYVGIKDLLDTLRDAGYIAPGYRWFQDSPGWLIKIVLRRLRSSDGFPVPGSPETRVLSPVEGFGAPKPCPDTPRGLRRILGACRGFMKAWRVG